MPGEELGEYLHLDNTETEVASTTYLSGVAGHEGRSFPTGQGKIGCIVNRQSLPFSDLPSRREQRSVGKQPQTHIADAVDALNRNLCLG